MSKNIVGSINLVASVGYQFDYDSPIYEKDAPESELRSQTNIVMLNYSGMRLSIGVSVGLFRIKKNEIQPSLDSY